MTPNDLVIVYRLRRKHTYRRAQIQRIRKEARLLAITWFLAALGATIFLLFQVI